MSKRLENILEFVNYKYELVSALDADNNPLIERISFNSKSTKPGDLFVCIVGENFDAHKFAFDAVKNGAKALLVERRLDDLHVPQVVVDNTAKAMALYSTYLYDNPSLKLRLLGITGTNGKTTVTHLLEKILEQHGKSCGLIGTLGNRFSSSQVYSNTNHTTPQAPDLQYYLTEMVRNNMDYAVMEVSSHALDLHRVLGCHFSVALLTNITQDHLDFHVTMDNYANAKAKLFKALAYSEADNKSAIINFDDSNAKKFIDAVPEGVRLITYGIHSDADIKAEDIYYSLEGTTFNCVTPTETFEIKLKITGQFSVYNALSAISIAIAEGVPSNVIQEALYNVENVPGRFEAVCKKPLIVVDYAHTPDGLSNVLSTARQLVSNNGKLITVFGCGGDRDPTKRPKMGAIVEQLSDKLYVTSDNPRTEDPQQIITDILTGIRSLHSGHVKVEIDRAAAIEMAIKDASEDDIIVVAGKGHEDYQILADRTIHFDDREVVREVVNRLKSCNV